MAVQNNSCNVIEIRDAYMRYSSKAAVFQGLNMTVKKGTIYGLLGPSGCGKTTILNCITGISNLDTGTIFVRYRYRRQIGFMPQEAALIEKFTVHELLHYFGKVYGLDEDTVEKRAKQLLSLVNLPPNQFNDSFITSLSGGQLRRVSLIVALIHDPDLLILDEPTVGLDPLTRFSLWEFFLKETSEREKTILITTHYIEEARQSHMIGLMRDGVLLAEDPPEKLLIDYGCETLEEVFLILSQSQAESSSIKPFPAKCPQPPVFVTEDTYCNFKRVFAQTQKNFCWMKRNMGIMALILLVPGVMTFLFCSMHINHLKGLRVVAVPEGPCTNQTDSEQSRCKANYKSSCHFLYLLRKRQTVIEYPDLPSGMNALKKGRGTALIYFKHNYTEALLDYYDSSMLNPPKNITLDYCTIDVTVDMTEKLKGRQVKRDIYRSFYQNQRDLLKSCGIEEEFETLGDFMIDPTEVYGSSSGDITYNALPGFIIPFVFYLSSIFTSSAAASEKSTGVFRRSLVSGLLKLEINLAHVLLQLPVSMVQNCLLMGFLYVVFDCPMDGSFGTAFTFILFSELQGVLYGIFLASVIKNEVHLLNAEIGTTVALFVTSGMIRPIEYMLPQLKNILDYSPIIVSVEAYRSVSRRGWGLENPKIMSALRYNVAATAVMLAANIVTAKNNFVI